MKQKTYFEVLANRLCNSITLGNEVNSDEIIFLLPFWGQKLVNRNLDEHYSKSKALTLLKIIL